MGEDLGGIIEIMLFTFAFFIVPLATFSFNLKATKKLFYVRTGEKSLMRHKDKKCATNEGDGAQYKDFEFCLTKKDKALLFFTNNFKFLIRCVNCIECRKINKRARKLNTIYETGIMKVNKSLNVATLIRNSRTLKILLENLILSDDIVHRIDHHDENVIDLNDYK